MPERPAPVAVARKRLPGALRAASIAFCCVVLSGATGCSSRFFSPFQMEIQQGNYITRKEVDLLREGMTRDQVRFVMGTPLVSDLFRVDRWDYIYTHQPPNSNRVERRRVTVSFDGDIVKRLDDENIAPDPRQRADADRAANAAK